MVGVSGVLCMLRDFTILPGWLAIWVRIFCATGLFGAATVLSSNESDTSIDSSVSFHRQIRPIFQTHCQGCHQPAKARGGYIMTDFARLLAVGDSGELPIVSGDPESSLLYRQILPVDGEAEMPQGKPA